MSSSSAASNAAAASLLIGFDLAAELLVLALGEHVAATQTVDARDAWRSP